MTFKIGVNLCWLAPGVVGGSEEYAVRLLQGVRGALDENISLCLYGRQSLFETYPDLVESYETKVMPGLVSSKGGRIALESTWLPYESRKDDLVHHFGGVVPTVRSQPVIVTIHDLQPMDMPQNFNPVKRRWIQQMVPYSARVARLVLCPSAFTASRLRDRLDLPNDKIRVVYHGHGEGINTLEEPPQASTLGRYLLYPAIAYPHKRHKDLVEVLGRLHGDLADLNLVFTGGQGPETAAITEQAEALGVSHRLHLTGRISSAKLEALYRGAQALVFPSAYEGFGNPALEAMIHGCPVIVSDAGALPEVVGDAGLIVPVGDIEAMVAAVSRVVSSPKRAGELRERGRIQAKRFTESIAAAQLADVYREGAEDAAI